MPGQPTITAVAQPLAGCVMITVNFSAIPAAKYAGVVRVEANGTQTFVRCNTSTDSSGNYMELSAGIAILYDCEAPRDVTLTYVASGKDANGNLVATPLQYFHDSFDVPPTSWTGLTNATIAQSSTHVLSGTTSAVVTSLAAGGVTASHSQIPNVSPGDNILFTLWLYQASLLNVPNIGINWYDSTGSFISSSPATPVMSLPAGAWTMFSVSAVAPVNTVFFTTFVTWNALFVNETIWIEEGYASNLTQLTGGTATSGEIVLASSGFLALVDPINPANNLRITLTPPAYALPQCQPGEGIFFSGMSDRTYGTQTTNWNVNNSTTPLPLSQVRQQAVGGLQLITRTFSDSAALTRLTATGNALWMFVPDKYGYESGVYLSVGDVGLSRVSRDQRRQWQVANMPWVIVGRIGGLSYGILGTRWQDLCTPYTSIQAATTAGVTWSQVLSGQASVANPHLNYRTWAQVKTSFATWSAVNNGTRTWQLLLAGL